MANYTLYKVNNYGISILFPLIINSLSIHTHISYSSSSISVLLSSSVIDIKNQCPVNYYSHRYQALL